MCIECAKLHWYPHNDTGEMMSKPQMRCRHPYNGIETNENVSAIVYRLLITAYVAR